MVAGLSAGTAVGAGGIVEVAAFGVELRDFFALRAGGPVTSAGAGPTSAGFATSVPTAAAGASGAALLLLRLAIARAGAKLQG